MIHLVLLSGGSGTRLWPLSNDSRSKQFLKVLRDEQGNHVSMVQRVFAQASAIDAEVDITIATSESQRDSIERQLPEGAYQLVLEPERRDTAPAIMLACAHLLSEQGASEGDTVVVMPIDTYADQVYYDSVAMLEKALEGDVDLALLGVAPTYSSEKYGYIVPASREEAAWPVATFREKPCEDEARALVARGALWNCGVFAFKLSYVLGILGEIMGPNLSFEEVCARYSELPKMSFDYAVVEAAERVVVVPYMGFWKDLGTWNTLTEEMDESVSGRVAVDDETCRGVHVINETGLPLVVAGVRNVAIVATHDGILVVGKPESSSPRIKELVGRVAETRPMYERRRWGEYRVLDSSVYSDGRAALTKEIILEPGGQFSYQRHNHRSEVWTVVAGKGECVIDGKVRAIEPGSVVDIALGQMHAARAISKLHLIEVQIGCPLVEEDIERFGNYWL